MRKRRLMLNTWIAVIYQTVTIICGLILPRSILRIYGSDVNGLVDSITQFLGFIAFFEMGVGAVIKSALYKPLSDRNNEEISKVVVSGDRFFRTLAYLLVAYILILIVIYPTLINDDFDFGYTSVLILAIGINLFCQYYFGNVNRLLVTADQHEYIFSLIASMALLVNTGISVLLMELGCSIQVIKLSTSLIYLCKPLILHLYVKRHYALNRRIQYTEEPVRQKKNGVAQHLAAYVLGGTDSVILTLFSTLSSVSVYSVYNLVVSGVKTMATFALGGIEAMLGELWAKQEVDELNKWFGWFEWLLHTIVILLLGICAVLIVPFVQIYTLGIRDADYEVPVFAFLLTTANMLHCLRLPYNVMILVGNKYKETQNSYIVSALMNIVISVLAVRSSGLAGVAVGTLISMAYQTLWTVRYVSQHLIRWPVRRFLKQISIDGMIFGAAYFISFRFEIASLSYASWVVLAVKVSLVWIFISAGVNFFFYKEYIDKLKGALCNGILHYGKKRG